MHEKMSTQFIPEPTFIGLSTTLWHFHAEEAMRVGRSGVYRAGSDCPLIQQIELGFGKNANVSKEEQVPRETRIFNCLPRPTELQTTCLRSQPKSEASCCRSAYQP